MLKELKGYIERELSDHERIPEKRKAELLKISYYIQQKLQASAPVKLVFICTHNSRRSHMAQLWAQAAAHYYDIDDIQCFSGGTVATAFHPSAVRALQKAGFRIERTSGSLNPEYRVTFAEEEDPVMSYSKKFDEEPNPREDFAAVMTCSEADEACPFVPGAQARFSLPYEDPKASDGTPREEEVYDERCRQIGREMFFVFNEQ